MRGWFVALGLLVMTAAPAFAQPVSPAALAKLEQRLKSGEIPDAHGVLVVQDGKTLAEWYFKGRDQSIFKPPAEVVFDAGTLHDVRSVTKTIVGLLVGIAVGEGAIGDLDAPVLDYFPEHADLATPERRRITLRHLLTMTSGLAWDETTYPYTDPRNSEIAMSMAPDRYRYVLSQDIVAPAGQQFKYSGGDVELIAAVVARATKRPIEDYAREKLLAPLGVTRFEWIKDHDVPIAASGMRLTPPDMAKIGQLILDGGVYEGRRVVSSDWIAEATSPHAAARGGPFDALRYGYLTWLAPEAAGGAKPAWIAGIGNGGQRIWVVPARRLVVVSTFGLYDDRRQGTAAMAVLQGVLAP